MTHGWKRPFAAGAHVALERPEGAVLVRAVEDRADREEGGDRDAAAGEGEAHLPAPEDGEEEIRRHHALAHAPDGHHQRDRRDHEGDDPRAAREVDSERSMPRRRGLSPPDPREERRQQERDRAERDAECARPSLVDPTVTLVVRATQHLLGDHPREGGRHDHRAHGRRDGTTEREGAHRKQERSADGKAEPAERAGEARVPRRERGEALRANERIG